MFAPIATAVSRPVLSRLPPAFPVLPLVGGRHGGAGTARAGAAAGAGCERRTWVQRTRGEPWRFNAAIRASSLAVPVRDTPGAAHAGYPGGTACARGQMHKGRRTNALSVAAS